jgi:BirA family biotin operon repressor/biotin-[acetyl-CoA-carboxylase] ligase
MLNKSEIRHSLRTRLIGRKIFLFKSLDSTNDCARALAEAGSEEGGIVIAEEQTHGKGRLGRRWEAEPGSNLLFSILLRPDLPGDQAGMLTLAAAVAAARAVESFGPFRVETKWPNDLLIGGKKFTGILIETSLSQDRLAYAVVGIGINVNQRRFPENLSGQAISLALAAGKDLERAPLLAAVLTEFEAIYTDVRAGRREEMLSDWKRRCVMLGEEVELTTATGVHRGTAVDLAADGALLVDINGHRSVFYAGDVTLRYPSHTPS